MRQWVQYSFSLPLFDSGLTSLEHVRLWADNGSRQSLYIVLNHQVGAH